MKRSLFILLGYFMISPILSKGQQPIKLNDFKIGIFGAISCKTHNVNGCDVPYETPIDNGFNTSVLNVLSEDGFNIVQTYAPNEWTSESFLKSYLKLAQANNFKVELGAAHYYKPIVDVNTNYLGYGTNDYNNCGNPIGACFNPYSQNYFRADLNNFIDNIYKLPPYKDIIWGYHICEEASYYHFYQFTDDCQGNDWGNPAYFKNVELPPTNVYDALSYFKTSFEASGITNHKMILMEANHHRSIQNLTIDHQGIYNPQQYLQLLNKHDDRDVFFDGSYTQFSYNDWLNEKYSDIFNSGPNDNLHYLGKFKSIDYEKMQLSQVHSVIASYVWDWPYNDPLNYYNSNDQTGLIFHYHSDISIPNANWLWFQAYNSIIHGSKGIWFWDINAWAPNDINNMHYMNDNTNIDGFERQYFPELYKNYLSNIAKEIRFLVNSNLISTDENTIVVTKTDMDDVNCILPPASTYIPTSLPAEKRTENYGLRYTIRCNGAKTIMILTNPLNVPVNISLNFANSSNQQIQNSTGVNVLFENNQYPVTSNNYKVDRNSNVNLINGSVGNQYYINYNSNKQLPISLGPLDVKVLEFTSASPITYKNDWMKVWSNFGSGSIGGHNVKAGDLFYTGDFDGDGTDELLCVGYNPTGTTDWITVVKYENDNWSWYWSNYGSQSLSDGLYPYRNNFVIGDFDGDGTDELLGNDLNGWTTLFKFKKNGTNNSWQWIWSDNGKNFHPIRPYKDKFYSGDFDGDGVDELLGCDLPMGRTTEFKWNGSDFIWGWSDYGTNHAIRPYRHNMLTGDFNGDGSTELLGFDNWATLFHFDGNDWKWVWSTYGVSSFAGWTYPPSFFDRILAGNIDSENKDELFFIQNKASAQWATTMDLNDAQSDWNWNWSANPQYSTPYINDWSLSSNGGSDTKYYLIKIKPNEPKHLLAMRKFCNSFLVNLYKTNSPINFRKVNIQNTASTVKINEDIEIFPNPTSNKVRVLSFKSNITSVEILDLRNQIIYNEKYDPQQNIEIDMSQYVAGIYFIKLKDSKNSISIHKIILTK